ncbi:MAG: helix-turn-helix transcriptional regulator [Sandaracinus sp.]|nr:helix-turn-helix transcriptional regulator [Sandaracinus sp.]MCB9615316.1 helix-turn-helix transcriptional regulator [Sandaracinus sp.]
MTAAARRQREKEARREAILEAAEARLREVGPRTLTMDEVAHLAELSKGALYLYFPSKDALLAPSPSDVWPRTCPSCAPCSPARAPASTR